jgi:chromosome segregation ATPase
MNSPVENIKQPNIIKVKKSNKDDEKKSWNMKATLPHVEYPTFNIDNLKELSCGCSCLECRTNYMSYWEQKSLVQELKGKNFGLNKSFSELQSAKANSEFELKEQIGTATESIQNEINKNLKFQEDIDKERGLRLQDKYRVEMVQADNQLLREEKKIVENKLLQVGEDYISIQRQLTALSNTYSTSLMATERLKSQLESYEQQILQLESTNGNLRSKYYSIDMEANKLKQKNENMKSQVTAMKDIAKSIPEFNKKKKSINKDTRDNTEVKYVSQSNSNNNKKKAVSHKLAPLTHSDG